MSGVKLYNQPNRAGGSSLDAIREPPRATIRRRMVRTLVDVALVDYDRWYVLAHSLGTVVAYNGLMEPAHTLPNYLDEARWRKLVENGLAGPSCKPKQKGATNEQSGETDTQTGDTDNMMPPRPVWLADNEVVYRPMLFKAMRGLLTYGSPLDKFARIWPARVAINKNEYELVPVEKSTEVDPDGKSTKVFDDTEWINVFDATDPVGSALVAFSATDPKNSAPATFKPENLGYRSSLVVLLGHIEYLTSRAGHKDQLVDRVCAWLIDGGRFDTRIAGPSWYPPVG